MSDNQKAFIARLTEIAGKNTISVDDKEKADLAKCCMYLAMQLNVMGAKFNEEIEGTPLEGTSYIEDMINAVLEQATETITEQI
jgi:hypothetical protein